MFFFFSRFFFFNMFFIPKLKNKNYYLVGGQFLENLNGYDRRTHSSDSHICRHGNN